MPRSYELLNELDRQQFYFEFRFTFVQSILKKAMVYTKAIEKTGNFDMKKIETSIDICE